MIRNLRFVSAAVLLFLVMPFHTSCSRQLSGAGSSVPAVIELAEEETSQRYNIQLDFMKHHLSGMLIVRRMPADEIRIIASTYFGLSLFDFSLHGDRFTVNSCIAPMQKEKVLKLLETDFKHLFLNGTGMHIKKIRADVKKESGSIKNSNIKGFRLEKRTAGRGLGKSVLYITGNIPGDPAQVKIKHPWIRLTIRLDKLSKDI